MVAGFPVVDVRFVCSTVRTTMRTRTKLRLDGEIAFKGRYAQRLFSLEPMAVRSRNPGRLRTISWATCRPVAVMVQGMDDVLGGKNQGGSAVRKGYSILLRSLCKAAVDGFKHYSEFRKNAAEAGQGKAGTRSTTRVAEFKVNDGKEKFERTKP